MGVKAIDMKVTAVRSVEIVCLIRVESIIGDGVEDDPIRPLVEYFTPEGERVARRDEWYEDQVAKGLA